MTPRSPRDARGRSSAPARWARRSRPRSVRRAGRRTVDRRSRRGGRGPVRESGRASSRTRRRPDARVSSSTTSGVPGRIRAAGSTGRSLRARRAPAERNRSQVAPPAVREGPRDGARRRPLVAVAKTRQGRGARPAAWWLSSTVSTDSRVDRGSTRAGALVAMLGEAQDSARSRCIWGCTHVSGSRTRGRSPHADRRRRHADRGQAAT